ncbi:MAG: hypothetical protein ACK4SY_04600 [Pyrobaculum sp.]
MVVVRVGEHVENINTVEDLERLCEKLRKELERCQYHSWYIRMPPDRLFSLLRKAYIKYTQGVVNVAHVISEFLEENKLSRSMSRVITPTLSSLGLRSAERFTPEAIEVGRLLFEGKFDEARARLRRLAAKNCVLREVMEGLNCVELEKSVEAVLAAYGKNIRLDELKYTAEFLRAIDPRCGNCDFKCSTREKIYSCKDKLIQISMGHVRDLFEKLDISLLPEHLDVTRRDGGVYHLKVRGTAKQIGVLLVADPVENMLPQIKNALAKLDERIEEGVYEVYIKIVPILEGDERCRSAKLLLEVVRGDLERVSKFVKLT